MLNRVASTKRVFPRTKSPARLSGPLTRGLNAYALAAAASGVTVLACVMPAEGAPVCKTLSIDLQSSATFPLNPANQFAAPFNVAQSLYSFSFYTTGISQFFWWNRGFFTPNSAGAKVLTGANNLPANVAFGVEIGPGGQFAKPASYGMLFTYGRGTYNHVQGGGTKQKHRGNLNLFGDNYVGFQFTQSGQVYYGWARLRVTTKKIYSLYYTSLHILGYGYETAPNTAIAAGSCSGTASSESFAPQATSSEAQPPSLGMLAQGSEGIARWRTLQP
jgi:hypothetical protein